jgi:hypothetical protein
VQIRSCFLPTTHKEKNKEKNGNERACGGGFTDRVHLRRIRGECPVLVHQTLGLEVSGRPSRSRQCLGARHAAPSSWENVGEVRANANDDVSHLWVKIKGRTDTRMHRGGGGVSVGDGNMHVGLACPTHTAVTNGCP